MLNVMRICLCFCVLLACLVFATQSNVVIAQAPRTIDASICDVDTASIPTLDPSYISKVQGAKEDISAHGVSVSTAFVGDEFVAYEQARKYATRMKVDSFAQYESLSDLQPTSGNSFTLVCLTAMPFDSPVDAFPLVAFSLKDANLPSLSNQNLEVKINEKVTKVVNETAFGLDIFSNSSYKTNVQLPTGTETKIALVFDAPVDISSLYLNLANSKFVMFGVSPTPESAAKSDQSTTAESQTEPSVASTVPPSNQVTSAQRFEEKILVNVYPSKWALTFDPQIEVRSFIGDQSVTPRRGQFLVIWFDQITTANDPLPLGSFKLQAGSGANDSMATYEISRAGTAALIVTEYDWNPNYMDNGVSYRTGVVFDIKPEDTHFELKYEVSGATLGPDVPVQITFDA